MKKCLSYTASIVVLALTMMASTSTTWAAESVSDQQVNEYIKANMGNPAAIADAMKKYNVNLDRIQQATGSSTTDIATYITNSGNPYLVTALNAWPPARSVPTALPPAPPATPQVQPAPTQPSPAATPATASVPGTDLTAMKAQLKVLTDANYQAYDKIATCRQSGKSDCSAEINAFNAIRQPAFDLGAKIAVLELESKTKADANTDFLNVERASEAATSAFYACLDTTKVTHTGCSSQGALALSIAEKTAVAARAVLENCTATPNGNASSCVGVRMQADAMTADVRAIETKIADTNTVAQYAAAPVQSATPAPKPASVTPVTEFKLPVITATELTAMKAQLKALQDANTRAYDKIATCKQSGKSDCSAEVNAFDAIRQPAFDLGAKIAAAELDSKKKGDVNADFLSMNEASYAATRAYYTCLDTTKVTHAGCGSQATLAHTMAEKTAVAARAVLDACIVKPNANASSCAAVRMQSDAMIANIKAIEDKIAGTNTVAQYVSAPDQSIKPVIENKLAPIVGNSTPIATSPVVSATHTALSAAELAALNTKADALQDAGAAALTKVNQCMKAGKSNCASEKAALDTQLKLAQDAGTAAYNKIVDCMKTDKSDCNAEREAFMVTRQPAFTIGAQVAAVKLDATKPSGNLTTDFYNAFDASSAARNAFYACDDDVKLTKADCSSQAALAKSLEDRTAAAARAILTECTLNPKSTADSCNAYRMQADAMDDSTLNARLAAYNSAPKPITIHIPSGDTTLHMGNGYYINSKGQLSDPKGVFIATITDDGKFLDPAGKPVSSALANQYASLFADSTNTADAGINVKKSGTTTVNTGSSYYGDDNNRDLGDDVKKVKLNITNAQIKDYITTHLQDPNAIANAMKQYNVDLSQIHDATGYTREQMADYIAKSNNAQLKSDLSKWTAAPIAAAPVQVPAPIAKDIEQTTPGYRTPEPIATATAAVSTTAAPTPVTNAQIDNYVRANLDNPQNISGAMAQYNVSLEQIQSATGYTRDEMVDYINKSGDPALKASLSTWK